MIIVVICFKISIFAILETSKTKKEIDPYEL